MSKVEVINGFCSSQDPKETERKIISILERIEMPGYTFTLIQLHLMSGGSQFFLRVNKSWPQNAEGKPGERFITLQHYSLALSGGDEEQVVRAVFEQIQMLELHEVAELFRYNGVRIYQPHVHPETMTEFVQRLRKTEGFYREEANCCTITSATKATSSK